jgi:hypothetical protein
MEQIEFSTTETMVNDYTNLDFDKIQYNHPVERNNCKYIDILHKNQDILIFKTPQLIVHRVIIKSETHKYVDLIINEKNKPFFEFIANIDDHNMLNIYNNSNRWFKKNIPLDILDDFHNPVMKMNKNGNAIFRTRFTNNKLDELKKGDVIIFIIKLDSIKLYRKEFTTQWVLIDFETDNIDYEFGDDMLEYESNYEFDEDEESDLNNNSSELDTDYLVQPNVSEQISNPIPTELDEVSKITMFEQNSNKSIKSDSTIKSYKKKRIIYANKEKIWNN